MKGLVVSLSLVLLLLVDRHNAAEVCASEFEARLGWTIPVRVEAWSTALVSADADGVHAECVASRHGLGWVVDWWLFGGGLGVSSGAR